MAEKFFGRYGDQDVKVFILRTECLELHVLELGATLQRVRVKGRDGNWYDSVLFHDDLDKYLTSGGFWGAVCGRCANRIGDAQVSINGITYLLDKNEGGNNLHSGPDGFHFKVFSGKQKSEDTVTFTRLSPDGEQGFPGNMMVTVTYRITPENGVEIIYQTTTDQDTVWNITNHAYFNLAGQGDILNHTLRLSADFYTPVDKTLLTTGEIVTVEQTPFDFRNPVKLSDRIGSGANQLPGGYDHNFVLCPDADKPLADYYCPDTGIGMEMYTTLPGVQIYSAAAMDGTLSSGGTPVPRFGGLCFETQFFPNSFSHKHFPVPVQKAGTLMTQKTEYRFYTQ